MCDPSVCGVVEAGCSVRFGLCVLMRERCDLCILGGVTGTMCASLLRLVEGLVMIIRHAVREVSWDFGVLKSRFCALFLCGAGDAVRKYVSHFTLGSLCVSVFVLLFAVVVVANISASYFTLTVVRFLLWQTV